MQPALAGVDHKVSLLQYMCIEAYAHEHAYVRAVKAHAIQSCKMVHFYWNMFGASSCWNSRSVQRTVTLAVQGLPDELLGCKE